ncbi:AMP-binding protein [Paenibacillus woosongensis]|uniref:Long-chain-fatty-acid--CoA ligase n=1 Tax=Paenibacillus woosongensis TaxID=307580 RepID=A0AA95IE14_9BACL|nr:AMP-binding protein [Paenibacillus woosongensis]WHX50793.1 AMP-binding protein [Paenibacillus woosongensis]
MKLFWVDEYRNQTKSYSDLIKDLNSLNLGNSSIFNYNPYHIYLQIIHSILCNYKVTIVDKIPEEQSNSFFTTPLDLIDETDLYKRLNEQIDNSWRITILTSGTTSKPKAVEHSLESLTRAVKKRASHADDIWALAYHPTHFAALQVFFQAFWNKNTIVNMFDIDKKHFALKMKQFGVTHISATPTFYRNTLFFIDEPLMIVKRVVFGGEVFDKNLVHKIKGYFPNAKIKNIYATTEAGSLFSSCNGEFIIPIDLYKYISFSKENELLIHKALLGEFHQEKSNFIDEWFPTGDIVEKVNEVSFRFIGRKTEMINVGGYKVNPMEVEDEIRKISGVVDVIVTSKENKLIGNVLIAEVIAQEDQHEEIISFQIKNLSTISKWKVPRVVRFVETLNTSRTGKLIRRHQ